MFTLSLLAVMAISDASTAATLTNSLDNPCSGAFLDKVVYEVISGGESSEIASLQSGTVDVLYNTLDDVNKDTLDADSDIGLYHMYQMGYGHLTINCRDYPLNISGLRRAFAYAYDKTSIRTDVLDGNSVDHDSIVPLPNIWCIEEDLPWHYYSAQPDIGNQILDDLGFTIDGETGYRLAPDGSSFDIVILYPTSSPAIGIGVAQEAVNALQSLYIDASTQAGEPNELVSRLDDHGDYDMIFYGAGYPNDDVEWLAYEYWSDYANTPFMNPTNFANSTFDSWRNQLLNGNTYEEIYEAAAEMQKILQYNVPRLVVYEYQYLQAARVDEFVGYVEDLKWGVGGPWTNLKVHDKSGNVLGGTLTIGISEDIDTFNIFEIDSPLEELITGNLYSSLYKYGPGMKQYPDLADSILIQTHDTNPSILSGFSWVTVDIKRNANWTDGYPLTATDVAFTFNYIEGSGAYGNPMATEFSDFVSAVVTDTYQVRIQINSDYWLDIEKYMHAKIIPEHIFNDTGGIGYDGWNSWDPVFGSGQPHVTSGPFYVSDYDSGTYELSRNTEYYWPSGLNPTTTTTTTNVTTTSGGQFPLENLTTIIIIGSVGVIIVVIVLFVKSRR